MYHCRTSRHVGKMASPTIHLRELPQSPFEIRMAQNKTTQNDDSVDAFLNRVEDESRRDDCQELVAIMQRVSGEPPKMWGPSIIGFGSYHYTYESGREGDMPVVGFSPRKNDLTLYLYGGIASQGDLLKQLGKHKTGKGCLYIKKLADVDLAALGDVIASAVARSKNDR